MDLHWMPPEERCGGHVVVAAVQMLNVAHAPTHQTLETCRTLQRDLGKRVLLVNTAEMPRAMPLPYYGAIGANFAESLTGLAEVAYKGEVFAFRQFAGGMKTDEELTDCLRTVAAWKPEFVFTIGGPSVAADLCAGYTTVVTLPMAAGFPVSAGTLFVALGVPDEKQRRLQQALQVPNERVTFLSQGAFDLPPRSATLHRAALGIPDGAFVLVVAGNRLDDDITGEFAAALAGLLETAPRAFAVFVGPFQDHDQLASSEPDLRDRTRAIGFQTDLLAAYEIGDAFLNPPRLGGGSSAAFALAVGLPVLTLAQGDVAAVVGEAFVFPSFAAIEAEVRRLMADAAYREMRQAQARSRWDEISDRKRMMGALLGWIEERLSLRA
jgi:glycosyltransferase involved in cell wall biosynthesis